MVVPVPGAWARQGEALQKCMSWIQLPTKAWEVLHVGLKSRVAGLKMNSFGPDAPRSFLRIRPKSAEGRPLESSGFRSRAPVLSKNSRGGAGRAHVAKGQAASKARSLPHAHLRWNTTCRHPHWREERGTSGSRQAGVPSARKRVVGKLLSSASESVLTGSGETGSSSMRSD